MQARPYLANDSRRMNNVYFLSTFNCFVYYQLLHFFLFCGTGMLRYGKESRIITQRALNEICRDLRCTNVPTRTVRQVVSSGLLSHTSHPALEGTTCGDGMVS